MQQADNGNAYLLQGGLDLSLAGQDGWVVVVPLPCWDCVLRVFADHLARHDSSETRCKRNQFIYRLAVIPVQNPCDLRNDRHHAVSRPRTFK